jgi:acetylglutamate kinase
VLVVETEAERALVERAARDLNRQVVHALNEAGVPALRLTGAERGLLRWEAEGGVGAGRVGWLRPLVRGGVVPVLALLAAGVGGRIGEAPADAALAALARALRSAGEAPVLVLLAEAPGATTDAGRRALAEGVRVRVASPAALRGAGLPVGRDLTVGQGGAGGGGGESGPHRTERPGFLDR